MASGLMDQTLIYPVLIITTILQYGDTTSVTAVATVKQLILIAACTTIISGKCKFGKTEVVICKASDWFTLIQARGPLILETQPT